MIDSQESIKSLQQAIAKEDSARIFALSQDLLKKSSQDLELQQCFAISAIKLKNFEVLQNSIFMEEPKQPHMKTLFLYFLYSSGQYKKCIETMGQKKKLSTHEKLIAAQAYFKNLQYEKSTNILAELLRQTKLSQEEKQTYMIDLLAGCSAGSAASLPLTKEFGFLIDENSCKETYYNYALALHGMGDQQNCKKYLEKFEKQLGKEDQVDWLTVKLFKDYLQMIEESGSKEIKGNQNIEQYNRIVENPKDSNLKSVAFNNLLILQSLCGEHEGHIDYKQFDEITNPFKYKLSQQQRAVLRVNKLSLLLRKNRFTEAVKLLKEIESMGHTQSEMNNFELIRNKYYLLKKQKDYEAIDTLIKEVMKENQNLGFCLLADISRERQDNTVVLSTLQEPAKWKNQAIKNYVFSLLIKDESMFQKYSEYLQDLAVKSSEIKILEILLKIYENKKNLDKQKSILGRILSINHKNTFAKAKIAGIYLQIGDISKAQEFLKGIEMSEEITDLNYLQYIEKNIHISKKEEQVVADTDFKKDAQKKRIRKKKKVRLPKNIEKFVENHKPDLEQWLPKWQRKGYKRKGKKGGKTQGVVNIGREERNNFSTGVSTSAKQVTKQSKRRR